MLRYAPVSAQGLIDAIASVNTRLYAQLLGQGRAERELRDVRGAYELACEVYSGAYQADGRPFVAHVVSVASIVALLGMPSDIVAAALLHNVYGNADFGDGLWSCATDERRRRVRRAVGVRIEACVHRFSELRLANNVSAIKARLPQLDPHDRMLLAIELADALDKYADLSVLFFGDGAWVTRFVDANEQDLMDIGYAIEQPMLAGALQLAIARVRASSIPHSVRSAPDRKYLYTIVAPSQIIRPRLKWASVIKQSWPWQLARRMVRGVGTAAATLTEPAANEARAIPEVTLPLQATHRAPDQIR